MKNMTNEASVSQRRVPSGKVSGRIAAAPPTAGKQSAVSALQRIQRAMQRPRQTEPSSLEDFRQRAQIVVDALTSIGGGVASSIDSEIFRRRCRDLSPRLKEAVWQSFLFLADPRRIWCVGESEDLLVALVAHHATGSRVARAIERLSL